MSEQHRYAIGQIVNIMPNGFESPSPTGPFEILRQFPEVDGEPQYRVKSHAESFERMVGEGRLLARDDEMPARRYPKGH